MDLIEELWRRAAPAVFISREEFIANLEGCEIALVEHDGAPLAIRVVRGAEYHFVTLGTGKPIPLAVVRAELQPIIDAHGCVTTRTPKDEPRQRRFNRAIGFEPVGEDEFFIHYRMTTPFWAKRDRCRS